MRVMYRFEFPLSLSLSLSLTPTLFLNPSLPPLSLRVKVLVCWCRLTSFNLPRCREICLLYRFSLLIGSNWVFFAFLPRRSRIGRKITFNYFYFLTNFIDNSLCADPMRRNPFFHFEESLSIDNIQ